MGLNINETDQTNIILNTIKITYSVLLRFPLPYVWPIPLASNLIRMPKLRQFLMIGQRSSLCHCHILRSSYHSKTGWVPYQIRRSHKSTRRFLTINQPRPQQSAWPSNCPAVQRSHPLCRIMTLQCCSVFLCCKN